MKEKSLALFCLQISTYFYSAATRLGNAGHQAKVPIARLPEHRTTLCKGCATEAKSHVALFSY